jgi:hypothetical protein
MPALGKKLHHCVPRFYLKPWANRNLIYCLVEGKVLHPNIRNVGAENHFYRLRELSSADVSLIRDIAIKDSPEGLKHLHEGLVRAFRLPHIAKRRLESSGTATPESLADVDKLIAQMNEDLHTSIEEDFKPYLDSMRSGDVGFYSDPAAAVGFFRGIAAQYLRTTQIRRARETMGGDKLETFERIVNVLVHIYAINLGFNLYAERKQHEILLLNNDSDVPFVTADQPAINIAANPKEITAPTKFELYYPLSPTKAMLLLEPSSSYHPASLSVSGVAAHLYNLHMTAHSYQQVFANSPIELVSLKNELPPFLSCY